ncbi:MAG: LD-carboxypeptidase [Thermoproteota archaeon]
METLETFGLKVKLGKHVFDRYHYNAGTREARIEDFNTMWEDPEVKMILVSQGGQTANHLLDGVDYRMMRKTPKIFTGVSGGTTLLNISSQKRVLQHIMAQFFCGCFVEKLRSPLEAIS